MREARPQRIKACPTEGGRRAERPLKCLIFTLEAQDQERISHGFTTRNAEREMAGKKTEKHRMLYGKEMWRSQSRFQKTARQGPTKGSSSVNYL